jgi:hypothetical protein
MSRADVLTKAQFYAHDLADNSALDRFCSELIYELGRSAHLVNTAIVPVSSGAAIYSYPTNAIEMLDVFYDDKILSAERQETIEQNARTWQATAGTPSAWVKEMENKQELRIYPTSSATTGDLSYPNAEPLGVDMPDNAFVMLFTEYRPDPLVWMEDWMALEIASREFARESDHTDAAMAKVCGEIGQLLRVMVSA